MSVNLNAVDNIGASVFVGVIAFVSDSWPQVCAVVCAAIHAYIAIEKWRYEISTRVKD